MNVKTADARQAARPRFPERTPWPFGSRGGGNVPEPQNGLVASLAFRRPNQNDCVLGLLGPRCEQMVR